jgi:hypothetical protein
MAVLPNIMRAALQQFDKGAIDQLASLSREIFLLAMNRAIEENQRSITPVALRNLWSIHIQQQTATLPPQFRPEPIVEQLAETGTGLTDGALEVLFALILADGNDTLFFKIAPHYAARGGLVKPLIPALEQSGREPGDILNIVGQLTTNNYLSAQATVDTFTTLLADRNWDESYLPMVEQLARLLNQHPEVDAATGVLWKIAELSGELKSEPMLRVTTRRLLNEIGELVAENQVVESIQRLRKAIAWSATGRNVLSRWWRQHTREQGVVQLQKLDKSLEGKRSLEDLRAVVQTTPRRCRGPVR